jgi:hypothetical protein
MMEVGEFFNSFCEMVRRRQGSQNRRPELQA